MGGNEHDQGRDPRADEEPRATTGAGTGQAAFPVGVLAGAAVGGVGGALVGDETGASADGSAGASDPDNPGLDRDGRPR